MAAENAAAELAYHARWAANMIHMKYHSIPPGEHGGGGWYYCHEIECKAAREVIERTGFFG